MYVYLHTYLRDYFFFLHFSRPLFVLFDGFKTYVCSTISISVELHCVSASMHAGVLPTTIWGTAYPIVVKYVKHQILLLATRPHTINNCLRGAKKNYCRKKKQIYSNKFYAKLPYCTGRVINRGFVCCLVPVLFVACTMRSLPIRELLFFFLLLYYFFSGCDTRKKNKFFIFIFIWWVCHF